MKSKKPKVLLAISGGVDSSVAALLLKKQGYKIIAAFMKNWSDTKNKITGQCQWREERKIAQQICAKLNISLITLDFENQYKKIVVDEMFKKYKKGITPNPDVNCNNKIKFPLLWKHAQKLKCDFIATGHYAKIKRLASKSTLSDFSLKNKKLINKNFNKYNNEFKLINNISTSRKILAKPNLKQNKSHTQQKEIFQLLRAKDESKDQSYFLYRLTQKDLSHTLFPIGELKKVEVREIAQKNKFPNYNKKSTVGICFIGKINLKDFLKKKIPEKKGKILDPEGKIIGMHDGIYYYTIGQRIGPHFGIEIEKGKFEDKKQLSKWYIAKKDIKTNTIIAAPENHPILFRKEIILTEPHWINEEFSREKFDGASATSGGWVGKPQQTKIHLPKKVFSRIRQVGELLPSTLSFNKSSKKYKVILNKAITGISQGQAIVLYDKKVCLGGGVIEF